MYIGDLDDFKMKMSCIDNSSVHLLKGNSYFRISEPFRNMPYFTVNHSLKNLQSHTLASEI